LEEPVHKAIEILMGEHRLIEQVLGSLETFVEEAGSGGQAPDRSAVADYAAFFRGFADACHHGKEEDILFARMIERGFSREAGPIAVMLEEHRLGRGHVSGLAEVGAGSGPLEAAERASVLTHALDFIPLLRGHILKEDRILYPMAVHALTAGELDAMEAAFHSFEKRSRADGTYERLQDLAARLQAAFRPDPVRMALAAEAGVCGG
jgi:hemerythrin-like domain-containing protein